MRTHEDFMQMAYDLALKGWGHVSPNPLVGAVIVKSGKIIAGGWHPHFGGPHAEAMAIAKAGKKAKGADLYVTLEPCSHFGKTPPCTQAIIEAGIKHVYVGVLDPNKLMNGKSVKLLQKAGIGVSVGFLQEELNKLNESFNHYIVTKKPFVTAKVAQTIDGKIANAVGQSKWITSQEARDHAHGFRFGFDAILVGINTVLKDNPALNSTPRKNIKKIVLDTTLQMPNKGKIYVGTRPEDIIIFTGAAKTKSLKATIVRAPLKNGKVDLKWVLEYLGKQSVANLLIEGGSTVIESALRENLVHKMMYYIAPKIMGNGLKAINKLRVLKNTQMGQIGPDVLIEGYPTSL